MRIKPERVVLYLTLANAGFSLYENLKKQYLVAKTEREKKTRQFGFTNVK